MKRYLRRPRIVTCEGNGYIADKLIKKTNHFSRLEESKKRFCNSVNKQMTWRKVKEETELAEKMKD